MARTIHGKDGAGNVVVYDLLATDEFRLDTISFTLVTSAVVGNRSLEVLLYDDAQAILARVPDWNDCVASITVRYTFGVGLVPSFCVANDGGAVQNDLPDTRLGPGYAIEVRSVGSTGAVFSGDRIRAVVLSVTDFAAPSIESVVPPYTPLEIMPPVAA